MEAELTRAQLADQLGVTPARISQLLAEGVLTRLPNGRYPAHAVQQYIEFIRKPAASKSEYTDLLLQEKLRELKRFNDEEDAKYAPRELLERTLAESVAGVISILETLPGKIQEALPEFSDEQIDFIRGETLKCCEIVRATKLEG